MHLINELYSKVSIDNNIFGYVKVDQIKIVSTPEQIKFYKGKDQNLIEIENNEIMSINSDYSLNNN